MYSKINDRARVLVAEPKLGKAIEDYWTLVTELRNTDVREDLQYQRRYRRFWALNAARLSDDWHHRYFTLLEEGKARTPGSLEVIVRTLAAGSKSDGEPLQFSFATKLLHMLRPSLPVYDRLITAFYLFRPPASNSFERRLGILMGFYRFLRQEYERVLAKGLLSGALAEFRTAFPETHVTDEKAVDFLIWTFVRQLEAGALQRGELFYS